MNGRLGIERERGSRYRIVGFLLLSFFSYNAQIQKLLILAYGERMLRGLFVVKSESMYVCM